MKKEYKYKHFSGLGFYFLLVLGSIFFLNTGMRNPTGDVETGNFRKESFVKTPTKTVKNVVIVHGAFADGSGYKKLYELLTKKGFNVTIVQNPLTSLKDDVEATLRTLDKQDGPTILVGHSWAGSVITEAGMHPKVVALVYVAAFVPDKGETTGQLASSLPAAPENGIFEPDAKGFVYFDKLKFHAGFAADMSQEDADFMYASQVPIAAKCFTDVVREAAWKFKPSYGIVATEDKAINPDIERNLYRRAGAKITEIKGNHVIFMSKPDAVAKVILDAAGQN